MSIMNQQMHVKTSSNCSDRLSRIPGPIVSVNRKGVMRTLCSQVLPLVAAPAAIAVLGEIAEPTSLRRRCAQQRVLPG
eukprot:5445758-Heterocapsa_arctica.AAC.1